MISVHIYPVDANEISSPCQKNKTKQKPPKETGNPLKILPRWLGGGPFGNVNCGLEKGAGSPNADWVSLYYLIGA